MIIKRLMFIGALFLIPSYLQADQTGDCTMGTQYCEGNSLETTNTTTTTNTNTNNNTNNNTNTNTTLIIMTLPLLQWQLFVFSGKVGKLCYNITNCLVLVPFEQQRTMILIYR